MDDGAFDASRSAARMRDADAALTGLRERFEPPGDGVALTAATLGAHGDDAAATLQRAVDQWRARGDGAWTNAEPAWADYAELLGDRVAGLIGAKPSECVAAGGSPRTIARRLVAGFRRAADGDTVVVPEGATGATGEEPASPVVTVAADNTGAITPAAVADAVTDDTAVVYLPSVRPWTGQLLAVDAITEIAHSHGAYVGFDLAHSAGVVDHTLHRSGVDFGVWSSHRYLNAGPGAVAGLFVHDDNADISAPARAAWLTPDDPPSTGAAASHAAEWQHTPVDVYAAAPLFGALDVGTAVGITELRAHSVALTWYVIGLVDAHVPDCHVRSPRAAERRGGHVTLTHPNAEGVARALDARGVAVDVRPPDVLRVAPSPYYVSHEDIWVAVDELETVLSTAAHEQPPDTDANPP
ncbi:aminotransferase class V-fold PLP-dependent enzyme [Halobacterium sp. BOL4-2]|uniref:aminotransferase class V-fold PLP-dependent enzyme n=2 Tax=Halobacterium TaxID=2239 RepID=UPI001E376B5F|nr:aminotransferase class V-fold PLP-dependent enzyme [Halobacterium sp. BOL4-2]QRY25843.2 aminotransferase class V-fold PLP-dependent enzyme [Halobacterium sp. BOL4-2]